MNDSTWNQDSNQPLNEGSSRVRNAKARLLAMAEDHDAKASESIPSNRAIAIGGALAALGGLAMARLSKTRKGSTSRTGWFMTLVAPLLIRYAISRLTRRR